MKQNRYYQIIDGVLYIYESPFPKYSVSVSIVGLSDMKYYKRKFKLTRCWEEE